MTSPYSLAGGQGVYSVQQICRILQPNMTPRKVHYWLGTDLLSPPLRRGRSGHPTLLTFHHLTQIAAVQRMRDDLDLSLRKVRQAFAFVLEQTFTPDWNEIRFTLGTQRDVVIRSGQERVSVPHSQGVLPNVFPELEQHFTDVRLAWEQRRLRIPRTEHLVSDARVQAGAPIIDGTRLETSVLAAYAEDKQVGAEGLSELHAYYPRIEVLAIKEALEFEGVTLAA